MKLIIRCFEIEDIVLEVDQYDIISNVKGKIYNFTNIQSERQQLYFNNIQLDDCKTLSEYNIHDKDICYLLIYFHEKIQILVDNILTNQIFIIEVKPIETIDNLYTKIQHILYLQQDDDILIMYNNQILNKNFTVKDYNIQSGSKLYVYFN